MLMFGRESIRNPSNIVHAPMTLDLIASGKMTWHEAFASYQGTGRRGERGEYPMSMVGGNGAARVLTRVLNDDYLQQQGGLPNASGVRPTAEDRRNADELALREAQYTDKWLRENGVTDLNDPKEAKYAIDKMHDSTYDFYLNFHTP